MEITFRPWLYTLQEDFSYKTNYQFNRHYSFCDATGKEWLTIQANGLITVRKGYATDGCSPKMKIGSIVIGTPDGRCLENGLPITFHASLIHDALYQFQHDPNMPLSRKDMDQIFYRLLNISGFRHAEIYYYALRLFGWFYGGIARKLTRKQPFDA